MFGNLNSYGLNDGAIIAGTLYAVTGHEQFLGPLKAARFTPQDIVCTNPMYEGTDPPPGVQLINFKPDPRAVAVKEIPKEDLAVQVGFALRGEWSHGFPNYWSVLHHAIFYLILTGHREIHLHGCNLTPGRVNEAAVPLKHGKYCRRHTGKLLEACKGLGVRVYWHDNYQKFKEWQGKL